MENLHKTQQKLTKCKSLPEQDGHHSELTPARDVVEPSPMGELSDRKGGVGRSFVVPTPKYYFRFVGWILCVAGEYACRIYEITHQKSTRQLVKLNKITNEIQGNLPILFIIYYAYATLRFSKVKLQTYPILRFHLSLLKQE